MNHLQIANQGDVIRDNLTHVSDEKSHYTGLILVSGVDSPGITKALFDTLAPFSLTILDIEQVVIRERLILTTLISLNPDHAEAIEADLNECADRLSVDIATSFGVQADATIAAKTGLVHVVILAKELHPRAIAAVADVISAEKGNIERIHRTASVPITAIEFTVSGANSEKLRQSLATVSNEQEIDIAVSPGGLMRWAKKLVVLDMDSTLIQQEVIELLAAHAGAATAVKEITERAMRGEIDFAESLQERVALLANLPEQVIDLVREEIVLTPGARTLIETLHRLGHTVAVVSGGFAEVIAPILSELGISLFRANTLEVVDGKLTGRIIGDVIDRPAKAMALREFANVVGVQLEQTIAIGDGANDLDMISIAGMGIAFNAKPAVKAAADSSVSAPFLDSVLYLLGISREEIEEAGADRQ